MPRSLVVIITVIMLLYPILIFIGMQHVSPRYLAIGLALVLSTRFFLFKTENKHHRIVMSIATLLGVGLCMLTLVANNALVMQAYPIIMNALFFAVFFYSWCYPPTVITQIAQRITKQPLSDTAINYTQKVTLMWCGFFVFNGLIALWTTFFGNLVQWTLYNGFISYLLMGALFLGEMITRYFVKKKEYAGGGDAK